MNPSSALSPFVSVSLAVSHCAPFSVQCSAPRCVWMKCRPWLVAAVLTFAYVVKTCDLFLLPALSAVTLPACDDLCKGIKWAGCPHCAQDDAACIECHRCLLDNHVGVLLLVLLLAVVQLLESFTPTLFVWRSLERRQVQPPVWHLYVQCSVAWLTWASVSLSLCLSVSTLPNGGCVPF